MSTLKVLKEYLVGDDGYLLNEDNDGKTVMLSGAWGTGKTHFWLYDIKPELDKEPESDDKQKKKRNIYISLYGRESISELKFEVLKEAYNLEVKDDIISKSASMLSTIVPSFGAKSLAEGFDKLNKKAKEKKAEEILKSGSIICLDDFERKSSKIDLNDLFGYISQLALDYNCKIVIILNSDVFEGEEANVFKTVKEKTVNKFFYFEPTVEELFDSIYGSGERYKKLDEYKDEIFKAIVETREKNARIYIQVLDNCLEWIGQYDFNQYEIRALVFITVNFIQNHFVFTYRVLEGRDSVKLYTVLERYYQNEGVLEITEYFLNHSKLQKVDDNEFKTYLKSDRKKPQVRPIDNPEEFLHQMYSSISKKSIEKKTDKKNDKETTKENTKSESYYEKLDNVFNENKDIFHALYFYAYVLNVEFGLGKEKFDEINQFVKTGILLKKDREVQ